MITCPNCKKELTDDAKFCDACGTQIPESVLCSEEQKSEELAPCQDCDAASTEEAAVSAPEEAVEEKTEELAEAPESAGEKAPKSPGEELASPEPAWGSEKPAQPKSKKGILFAAIGIIALIAIFLAVTKLGGNKKASYCMYLKDAEVFYSDPAKKTSLQISSRLTAGEKVSNAELSAVSYSISSYITLSEDGNRIFFPDRISPDSEGVTLYYRDIKKPDQEAVKIDSNIQFYAIDKKGTKIAYIKGSDKVLYLSDLSNKEKLATGIYSFNVNDDLSKIGYFTEENSYYIWYANKDAVKVASDITYIEFVSEDLSAVYYTKNESLYKFVESKADSEKIASDVNNVTLIYESGELYFTRGEYMEKPLIDFVTDDMADFDAGVVEPVWPDYPDPPEYPYWWNYSTNEEYEAAVAQYNLDFTAYDVAYTELSHAYDAAYEEYWDKVYRDYTREELEYETMYIGEFELYYFDGKEEKLVTDKLVDDYDMSILYNKPAAVIQVYTQSELPVIKLSEIENYYDVADIVNEARFSSTERHVVVGASMSLLEQHEAEYFMISPDAAAVYFFDDVNDSTNEADLYKAEIKDGKVGKPQLHASDVCNLALFFNENDQLTYYKNVNYDSYKGDMFVNDKEIDYDVRLWFVIAKDDMLLYYTDWDYDKSEGTLKMYKDGTKTKIVDEVHDFDVAEDGEIFYLCDYSNNYYAGTLYRYNKGKPEKIADDVVELLWISEYKIRGDYSVW